MSGSTRSTRENWEVTGEQKGQDKYAMIKTCLRKKKERRATQREEAAYIFRQNNLQCL